MNINSPYSMYVLGVNAKEYNDLKANIIENGIAIKGYQGQFAAIKSTIVNEAIHDFNKNPKKWLHNHGFKIEK